uniref:Uncharacterized protein n=1 Tax=uncultured marine bacterium 442 TaxID=257392 RepID=Q6SH74_9BACT|nr:hypothetical protein MBMO_EBAC000-63A02.23 [uncultured marine bacterium 442]
MGLGGASASAIARVLHNHNAMDSSRSRPPPCAAEVVWEALKKAGRFQE